MHNDLDTYSSPQSSCPCCQLTHCLSWKKMTKVIRKLETETRLAAEIGQSLLQKNEVYLMESNHLKGQLKQCEDRKQELELSLDDTERLAQKLKHEKDKWMWQFEKSEKILNESVVDLENTNLKCAALTNDLEQARLEMEKLELFKYKSHQSDTREDTLQSTLEDTKQELMISRKTELALESKYKKLLARYESLSCTYQDLCKHSPIKKSNSKLAKPLLSIPAPTAVDVQQASTDELVAFIKELLSTNNDLKSKLLNTSTQLDDIRNEMNTLQEKHHNNINTTQVNKKLLGNPSEQLNENNQHTVTTTVEDGKSGAIHTNAPRRHHSVSARTTRSKCPRQNSKPAPSRSSTNKKPQPIPQATTSTPVVHHHYHYYNRQRQQDDSTDGLPTVENNDDVVAAYCDDQNCMDLSPSNESPTSFTSLSADPSSPNSDTNTANNDHYRTLSPETIAEYGLGIPFNSTEQIQQHQHHGIDTDEFLDSVYKQPATDATDNDAIDNPTPSIPTKAETTTAKRHSTPDGNFMPPPSKCNTNNFHTTVKSTPYSSLLDQAKSILQRLRSTDARILNRRLQRAFDIGDLSNMSNAILQTIMSDVDTLDARFFWLAPDENSADGENDYANKDWSSMSFLVDEFFPIVRLLQELLHEIGQLSITINHLQVAYVRKVEENEARVEKEIMGKHHHQSPTSNTHNMINNNSNISMVPSLVPSASISSPISCTSSAESSTEPINVNPVHWLSTLFATADHRPTTIPSPIDSNRHTSTITRPTAFIETGKDDDRTTNLRQRRLIRRKSTKNSTHHRQQRHQSYRSTENQKHTQFWPTLSSIMDEWNQTPTMKHFSSSLDREWLLDLH
ncbi:unnamed protein product [Absidia cylindrospora]